MVARIKVLVGKVQIVDVISLYLVTKSQSPVEGLRFFVMAFSPLKIDCNLAERFL